MTNATEIAISQLNLDELDAASGGVNWGTVAGLMTARNVAIGATLGCPGLAFEAGVVGTTVVMTAGVIKINQFMQ